MTDFILYIPSYNDSEAVAETVASSPDWPIVISDNCSDERHAKALDELTSAIVRVVHHKRSLGRMGNARWCVDNFLGVTVRDKTPQWFKMLMAGNRHTDGSLEYFRQYTAENPDARVVISAVENVFPHARGTWQLRDSDAVVQPHESLPLACRLGNVFHSLTAPLIHRDALAGGFDFCEGVLSFCSDFMFLLKLASENAIHYTTHPASQMVMARRKTHNAKSGTAEAIFEEALVRYRAAELYAEKTCDVLGKRELVRGISQWVTKQLETCVMT